MSHGTISGSVGVRRPNGKHKKVPHNSGLDGNCQHCHQFCHQIRCFLYRHYHAASFEVYWTRRLLLFLHINGGTLALLAGPWQFWTGLRQRHLQVHRWTGRLYLLGVVIGLVGAVGLAVTTTYGWGFEVGLMGLASAWVITSATAYYTIRKGLVQLHKEWMIRSYVVTFAFVFFRVLSDYGPTSRLQPENDRSIIISWVCWVVPLAVTEMIFQLKRIRSAIAARG